MDHYDDPRIDWKQVGRSYNLHRGKKQPITEFTPGARRKMLETLGRIRWDDRWKPLFVTLTYPVEKVPSLKDSYRDLVKFSQMCRRKWPGFCAIWKKEIQEGTGNVHYHLFVWGVMYRSALAWIKEFWYKAVGSGLQKHRRAGTQVKSIDKQTDLVFYMSKYVAKPPGKAPDGQGSTGRWWGKLFPKDLPLVKGEALMLSREAFYKLTRVMRKQNEKRLYRNMKKKLSRVHGRKKKRILRKKYKRIGRTTRRFLLPNPEGFLPLYEKATGDFVPF